MLKPKVVNHGGGKKLMSVSFSITFAEYALVFSLVTGPVLSGITIDITFSFQVPIYLVEIAAQGVMCTYDQY